MEFPATVRMIGQAKAVAGPPDERDKRQTFGARAAQKAKPIDAIGPQRPFGLQSLRTGPPNTGNRPPNRTPISANQKHVETSGRGIVPHAGAERKPIFLIRPLTRTLTPMLSKQLPA